MDKPEGKKEIKYSCGCTGTESQPNCANHIYCGQTDRLEGDLKSKKLTKKELWQARRDLDRNINSATAVRWVEKHALTLLSHITALGGEANKRSKNSIEIFNEADVGWKALLKEKDGEIERLRKTNGELRAKNDSLVFEKMNLQATIENMKEAVKEIGHGNHCRKIYDDRNPKAICSCGYENALKQACTEGEKKSCSLCSDTLEVDYTPHGGAPDDVMQAPCPECCPEPPCPDCGGRGWVWIRMAVSKGLGTRTGACSTCNGTGEVEG